MLGKTLIVIAALSVGVFAQEWPRLRPIEVATGFNNPVDLQNAADGSGRLFVVEQAGVIHILRNGRKASTPFLDITARVRSGGERGLLGLAFPPSFSTKRYFYVNYTEGRGAPDLRTVIARYRVSADDPDRADPNSEERILVVNQPYDNHNAGQLAFSPRDGYLYVGLGDGGSANDPMNNGQSPGALLGKMLRIDVESGIAPYLNPPGNPFYGRSDFRSEIWAWGLRNPWRYSFDPRTHDLWIGDVGQNRREEINFQAASSTGGENYGWRTMEASLCLQASCNQQGLTMPVFEYDRTQGFSVTGGLVYRGRYHPHWDGTYLLADYGTGRFWGLRRNGAETLNRALVRLENWPISAFGSDEEGEIYIVRHGADGAIFRLADDKPALRADRVDNAASGVTGVAPGGRVVIAGAGVSGTPGFVYAKALADEELAGFRVFFNDQPGRVAELYNLTGREALVAVAPDNLSGDAVHVRVERNGLSSDPVRVQLFRTQPALFGGIVNELAPGAEATFLGTGTGPFTREGLCAESVTASIGGQPAEVLACRASTDYAGVVEIRLRAPALPAGETSVSVSAGGASSPPVSLLIR